MHGCNLYISNATLFVHAAAHAWQLLRPAGAYGKLHAGPAALSHPHYAMHRPVVALVRLQLCTGANRLHVGSTARCQGSSAQQCDARHCAGLAKYGWEAHDGEAYGRQELHDGSLRLTTTWVKRSCSGCLGGDWALNVSARCSLPSSGPSIWW